MSDSEWKQWEDLPPEEEERLIDEIVKRLVKRRLGTLALMLLESGGPLTNLFAELWMGLYGPYFDFIGIDRYMALLRKKRNVEGLISRLDKAENEKKTKKTQPSPQVSPP